MDKLELRLYGFVPYNLSPMQQGIQFGHAGIEYGQMVKKISNKEELDLYNNWADNYKTFMVGNGGTTNRNIETPGTLNQLLKTFQENDITTSSFYEPDLGDQLSAFVFIVDERVFGKNEDKSYKWSEYENWSLNNSSEKQLLQSVKDKNYLEWVEYMGGQKNVFLRKIEKNFRFA